MLFREHRGGLKESMDTVYEFNNLHELKGHLDKEVLFYVAPAFVSPNDFEFYTVYQCYDERIGWESYQLMARYKEPINGHIHEIPYFFGYVNTEIINGEFSPKQIGTNSILLQ